MAIFFSFYTLWTVNGIILRPGSRRKTKNPAKNCRRCRSWENTAMTSLRGSLLRDFLLMTHTKRQSLIGSVLREYAIFVEGFKIAWALVGRYWSLTSSRRIPQASGQPQDSPSVMSYRRLPSSEQSRRPVSQYFIFLYLTHSPPLSPLSLCLSSIRLCGTPCRSLAQSPTTKAATNNLRL